MCSKEKSLTHLSARKDTRKETPLDLWVNIFGAHLTCLVLGDLQSHKNKDFEAAPVCTLFLQERNVDIGPCGWKDQFHRAVGPFEESGGGLRPLPLHGKSRQGGLLSITRASTLTQTPARAHELLWSAPRVVPGSRAPFPPRATQNNRG